MTLPLRSKWCWCGTCGLQASTPRGYTQRTSAADARHRATKSRISMESDGFKWSGAEETTVHRQGSHNCRSRSLTTANLAVVAASAQVRAWPSGQSRIVRLVGRASDRRGARRIWRYWPVWSHAQASVHRCQIQRAIARLARITKSNVFGVLAIFRISRTAPELLVGGAVCADSHRPTTLGACFGCECLLVPSESNYSDFRGVICR